MASAAPVEEPTAAAEAKGRLTGDSFIRRHLRTLAPYQPILPFEVHNTSPAAKILLYGEKAHRLLLCTRGARRNAPVVTFAVSLKTVPLNRCYLLALGVDQRT
jgi:hypothetical protein